MSVALTTLHCSITQATLFTIYTPYSYKLHEFVGLVMYKIFILRTSTKHASLEWYRRRCGRCCHGRQSSMSKKEEWSYVVFIFEYRYIFTDTFSTRLRTYVGHHGSTTSRYVPERYQKVPEMYISYRERSPKLLIRQEKSRLRCASFKQHNIVTTSRCYFLR